MAGVALFQHRVVHRSHGDALHHVPVVGIKAELLDAGSQLAARGKTHRHRTLGLDRQGHGQRGASPTLGHGGGFCGGQHSWRVFHRDGGVRESQRLHVGNARDLPGKLGAGLAGHPQFRHLRAWVGDRKVAVPAKEHQRVLARPAVHRVSPALAIHHVVARGAAQQVGRGRPEDAVAFSRLQRSGLALHEAHGLYVHQFDDVAGVLARALATANAGDARYGGDREGVPAAKQSQGVGACAAVDEVRAAKAVDHVIVRRAHQPVGQGRAQQRRHGLRVQAFRARPGLDLLHVPKAADRVGVVARSKVAPDRRQAANGVDAQVRRAGAEDHRVCARSAIDQVIAPQAVDLVVSRSAGQPVAQAGAGEGPRRHGIFQVGCDQQLVTAIVMAAER